MFKVNFKNLISENNNFSYFLIFLLVQSFAFADAYVSCGNAAVQPDCLEDYCAYGTELHEVRCCSDTEMSGYTQNQGCDVWAESEFGSYYDLYGELCAHELTYAEAVAVCAAEGARLCTQAEFNEGCTAGTGCQHDSDMIWTSDECLHGCMEEDACNYDPNTTHDNGSCLYQVDCAGECGGSSVEDECGVCNGNSNPQDCNNDGIDDVCEEGIYIAFDTGFFEGQSTGDVNHDGELTITDIVIIIDNILND